MRNHQVVTIIGTGLVGSRAARALRRVGVEVQHTDRHGRTRGGTPHEAPGVVILATESMHQVEVAEQWLHRSTPVVSTADRPEAVRALWTLDAAAQAHDASLLVGAGCAPGLSTLLVRHLASRFDSIHAITTARFGTGGPICAREHHRSMAAAGFEVRGAQGRWSRGGSGRELVWFPEPVGPQDCYRAGLSESFLLHQLFPTVERIRSLQAATRRDRLTARLPMLRPPHAEGREGAVWVELRGRLGDGSVEHRALAATAPQATSAAQVAATLARRVIRGELGHTPGLVDWTDQAHGVLQSLDSGITLWRQDGSTVNGHGANESLRAARKWRGVRKSGEQLPN